MKLLQLPAGDLRRHLAGPGIWLRTGPFSVQVKSSFARMADELGDLYGQFEVRNPRETFADFHVSVNTRPGLKHWFKSGACFSLDGSAPFHPLPLDHAYPMLERGLDWCISAHADQYLILHAAALEIDGRAVILAGPTGSGKSTLAAALALSGWRLLSDNLVLVERRTGWLFPLPRPVGLRDGSIALIRTFSPDAYLGSTSRIDDGEIAFMRPPKESVRRQHEPAVPSWIFFPHWVADAEPALRPASRSRTFDALTRNAVNYGRLGREGFRVCSALIRHTASYDFEYGDLDDAVRLFDRMAAAAQPASSAN